MPHRKYNDNNVTRQITIQENVSGRDGLSAYEIAIKEGKIPYDWSESEFIDSLKGEQGEQGLQGEKGDIGPQGIVGPTGPQGPAGPQGIQGIKGDAGSQGIMGPAGPQGAQGIQGLQGLKGNKGEKGDTFTYQDLTAQDIIDLSQSINVNAQRIPAVAPGALPAGPAGENHYMEVTAVGTWTYGGTPVGSNPEGNLTIFWWDGSTWSLNDTVTLPTIEGTEVLDPDGEHVPMEKAVAKYVSDRTPETMSSRNLFNPDAIQIDLYQSTELTGLSSEAGWECSEFIPVEAGTYYLSSDKSRSGLGTFDIDKNPVRYLALNTGAFTVEAGEAFVVFNLISPTSAGWTWAQLEKGSVGTDFVPYRKGIVKKEWVEGYEELLDKIESYDETLDKSEVFKIEKTPTDNLLNPNTVTVGVLVSGTTGALDTYELYTSSDFIPVNPLQTYRVVRKDGDSTTSWHARTTAFYDLNKQFIGGLSTATITPTTIANTAFMRIGVPSTSHPETTAPINDYALFEGSDPKDFVEFGNIVSVEIDGISISEKGDNEIATMGDVRNQPVPPNPAQDLVDALDVQAEMTANMLDPNSVINHSLLSANNGVATPGPEIQYFTSDYIPVEEGQTYSVVRRDGSTATVARVSAYYDENKVFLSGLNLSTTTLVPPTNARFVRFSAPNMIHGSSPATPEDFAMFEGGPQEWVKYGSEITITIKGTEPQSKPLNALATMADLQSNEAYGVLRYTVDESVLDVFEGNNRLSLVVGSARGFDGNDMTNFESYLMNGIEAGNSDDVAPIHMLSTTLGANHGLPVAAGTIESHGLTNTEIGRGWLHSNGTTQYIVRIIDADNILFMSDNIGTFEDPQYSYIDVGTISRAGVTKTITEITGTQLLPAIKNLSIKLYDHDGKEILKPSSGRTDSIKIMEHYDIMYPSDILENLKLRAGQSGEPVYDGRIVASIDNVYTITDNLTVLVSQTFRPMMAVSLQDTMVTQSSALGNAATTAQYYVPNSSPIGAINFRKPTTVAWSSSLPDIFFNVANSPDPTNPPNRVINYLEDTGFMIGHLLDRGVGQNLKDYTANTFEIRKSTGKVYPHPIEGSVVGNNGNAIVGKAFSAVVYRSYTKISTTRTAERLSLFTFNYDGALYVFADYNASVYDSIDLNRPDLLGKRIEVLDAVNCEVGSTVYAGPVAVSANYVEGETCFAVFKIW